MRYADILAILRAEIVDGRWPPGGRLPTRIALAERFGTTLVTIHRAMTRLIDDGFAVAQGRNGTRVSERPPHLCSFALVFPADLPPGTVGLDVAIAAVQAAVVGELGIAVRTYQVAVAEGDRATAALAEDLGEQRLAGAVLLLWDERWAAALRARVPHARLVVVGGRAAGGGLPWLWFDYPGMVRAGVARLAALGARRIAVLCGIGMDEGLVEAMPALAAERGLSLRPGWILGLPLAKQTALWSRQAVLQLLDRPPGERPDGLLVLDDHLLAGCHAAVAGAGLGIGRDLHLVSHWNHPLPGVPAGVETVRFDAGAMLRLAIARLRGGIAPGEAGAPLAPMP